MNTPTSLTNHRVQTDDLQSVCEGDVRWSPVKSIWFSTLFVGTVVAAVLYMSTTGVVLFLSTTAWVLLFGHSLGSHRKLIHNSYECPLWLERLFVYSGVLVGLAGPLGLLRQHELRDYAQRLPTCHEYLRHGRSFWSDGWWQLHCELHLKQAPDIRLEDRISGDRFLQFMERTWMLQQLPWAVMFYLWGGWGFVLWGVCARVTAGVLGHWLIGYFAHNQGGMHCAVEGAAVQGRNIRLTSLLTMGECWHNNHHAFPGSARLSLYPGEWDPGWWMLCLLNRFGLTWGFRLPQHLPERTELRWLDPVPAHQHPPTQAALKFSAIFRTGLKKIDTAVVRWPGSIASKPLLRSLLGTRMRLLPDPQSHRLVLETNQGSLCGLPAVCLSFALRGTVANLVVLPFLPVAFLANSARTLFALRPPTAGQK